jgi:hypothetical protein
MHCVLLHIAWAVYASSAVKKKTIAKLHIASYELILQAPESQVFWSRKSTVHSVCACKVNMITPMRLLTAFALTIALARAMPCNYTHSTPTSATSNSTTFHLPPLQLAELNNTSSATATANYRYEYSLFNGFLAVAILMAVMYLAAACAVVYVVLIRKRSGEDEEAEMDDAGTTGEEAGKPSFLQKICGKFGKKETVEGGEHPASPGGYARDDSPTLP